MRGLFGKLSRAALVVGVSLVTGHVNGQIPAPGPDCVPCNPAYVGGAPAGPPLAAGRVPGWNLYWNEPGCDYLEPCESPIVCDFADDPIWYFTADLLPLKMDAEDQIAFATRGEGRDRIALSNSDLGFEFDAGARLLLGRTLNEFYRLELSYFGTYNWTESAAVRDTAANALGGNGNLFSPFSNFGNPPIAGLDYNTFVRIDQSHQMNNGEINLRQHVIMPPGPWEVSALYGARYMSIDERFQYFSEADLPAPGATNDIVTGTTNDLIGLQLGMLSQFLLRTGLWIDFEMKGAMCHNLASQSTTYTRDTGAVDVFANATEEETTAFLGDLDLTINYHITPQFTVHAGYKAMWITGVALAAENLPTDPLILTLGPAQLDDSGELVYHGPRFGLTWAR